jgi:demethylmenaquinone methyltransferase/2-methoxy-6-polyprenyl-1,4-benzoquinol methylase
MKFILPEGEKKSSYVKEKFSVIAERYDFFNDIFTQGIHRYWKRYVVKQARLTLGDTAVDICCGTGDITRLIKKKVGTEGKTIGLDFSEGMLKIARNRKSDSGIYLLQGDASVLPLADNSVDAVTIGYGLRNLVDIEACLLEALRVLKPGGRFVCLDVGKVKLPIIRHLVHFYFFRIVPLIGKMLYPKEDLFDYFPLSSVNYPSQEILAGMLEKLGYGNVVFRNFYFGANAVHCAQKPLSD